MASTATTDPSASTRLREATNHLHDAAEHSPFQRALAKGRLPVEGYTANLGQLLHVHRALDAALVELRSDNPAINAVLEDEHLQSALLEKDLRHFGIDPDSIAPLASVSAFVAEIEATASQSPLQILGMLYVVEGANNGGHYFVTNIRRSYNLAPGEGDLYLDPYGDQQRVVWARFKANLDDAVRDDAGVDELLTGVKRMYGAIIGVGESLWEQVGSIEG